MDKCRGDQQCQFISFNQDFKTCQLYTTCPSIDASACPNCITSAETCDSEIPCNKRGQCQVSELSHLQSFNTFFLILMAFRDTPFRTTTILWHYTNVTQFVVKLIIAIGIHMVIKFAWSLTLALRSTMRTRIILPNIQLVLNWKDPKVLMRKGTKLTLKLHPRLLLNTLWKRCQEMSPTLIADCIVKNSTRVTFLSKMTIAIWVPLPQTWQIKPLF